jgi:hypothetical protein
MCPMSPCPLYSPLLPHTVTTTLNAIRDDIDAITLHNICKGLLETIRTHETTHKEVKDHISSQIHGLRDKVTKYQKAYNQEPEGYIKNTHFPNLKVPIRAGFYQPAKWIKRLDTGDIFCFTSLDRPCNLPHIVPIYASPLASDDTPAGPIPQWFWAVLTGPHPQFLNMVECAHKFKDWGVTADLLHYCKYDTELTTTNAKIHQLQLDAATIEQDHAICEQHLKALRCTEGLAHLKGLGPKSTYAKWGTHFTDDKEDNKHPRAQHGHRF